MAEFKHADAVRNARELVRVQQQQKATHSVDAEADSDIEVSILTFIVNISPIPPHLAQR